MGINIKDVIKQLESLRKSRNLTMEDMARICDMGSKSTYSEMLKRGKKFNLDYLINASNQLNFSLSDFFAMFEKPNTEQLSEPVAEYKITNNVLQRIEKLEAMFEKLKLSSSIDDFIQKWNNEEKLNRG